MTMNEETLTAGHDRLVRFLADYADVYGLENTANELSHVISEILTNDPLAAYRVDVCGDTRSDYNAALVAICSKRDELALTQVAIAILSEDVTDENHARILTAAADIIKNAVDTISAAEDVIEEQGAAKC